MRTSTSSTRFAATKDVLREQQRAVVAIFIIMASALTALLAQTRGSRSESHTKSPLANVRDDDTAPAIDPYPGSLHRRKDSAPTTMPLQSSQVLAPAPTLRPIASTRPESMEDWLKQKLSKISHHCIYGTRNADISVFLAANGSAAQVPSRGASPQSIPNGKPSSPEIPTTVASSDPKVAAQQANDMRNIVRRKLTGYVGFANLPNQWHRKSVRKGFNFNVMVVGKRATCDTHLRLS